MYNVSVWNSAWLDLNLVHYNGNSRAVRTGYVL